MTTKGSIVGVNGNMITVRFDGAVAQNEVGYALCGDKRLMAEIVRVRGRRCDIRRAGRKGCGKKCHVLLPVVWRARGE
jgi:hypothetical protein